MNPASPQTASSPPPRAEVFRPQGTFNAKAVPALARAIEAAEAQGAQAIHLDFAAVTDIDSRGLGALVGWHRHFTLLGTEFRLLRVGHRVRRAIETCNLHRVLQVESGAPWAADSGEPGEDLALQIVARLDEALLRLDAEGSILLANPASERLLGRSETELLGQPLDTILAGDTADADERQAIRLLLHAEDGPTRRHLTVPRPGGDPVHLQALAAPVCADGHRVGSVVGLLDVTELWRTESERARLATAIEQAAEAVVITGLDGIIQYVNPAFERVTGYSRHEAIGLHTRVLKSGQHDEAFYREMWQTLTRGEVWTGQLVNRRKDGTLYTEEATISPVRDSHGRVVNFVAVKRDVTREIEIETALRQSQKMEATGRLAGGVAHDFNNLLLAMHGHAEFALESLEPGHPARDDVQQVIEVAGRAAALTKQLLAFSRRQTLNSVELDVGAVISNLVKMLQRLIGENIRLDIACDPAAGPVRADQSQIEQVILNLVVNARDAMPHGGRIRIRTKAVHLGEKFCQQVGDMAHGPHVLITVSDTGQGMEAETLRHIFEPFFTTKAPGKGTGLGLATVYGIVRQHRGTIVVQSRPGEGATFSLYLPMAARTLPSGVPPAPAPPRGGGETILLAEDDESVRLLAVRSLEAAGYRVLAAKTGAEAVALFESRRGEVDLALLDRVMPELSGAQVCAHLRERRPGLPVIFSTGYNPDDTQPGNGAPSLQKPYTRDELLRQVRAALDGNEGGAGDGA
ncbi:MAG: PAS domain S-box protein [Candidatus Sumerlaeia bacterium]|nr:PAS domain S-box protein [Candidatus Sumerlaeia bacterium]